jgi:hypothetical protein
MSALIQDAGGWSLDMVKRERGRAANLLAGELNIFNGKVKSTARRKVNLISAKPSRSLSPPTRLVEILRSEVKYYYSVERRVIRHHIQ